MFPTNVALKIQKDFKFVSYDHSPLNSVLTTPIFKYHFKVIGRIRRKGARGLQHQTFPNFTELVPLLAATRFICIFHVHVQRVVLEKILIVNNIRECVDLSPCYINDKSFLNPMSRCLLENRETLQNLFCYQSFSFP